MFSIQASFALITILFIILENIWLVNGECSYVLHRQDETDRQPLYFILKRNEDIVWAAPQRISNDLVIRFKMLDKLVIACPVKIKDEILYKDMKLIHCNGYCTTTQYIRPDLHKSNGPEDPKPYSCDEKIHFIEQEAEDETCAGQAYEIGVQLSFISFGIEHWVHTVTKEQFDQADKKKSTWKKLFSICSVDYSNGIVYTKHEIDGKSINVRQKRILPDILFDLKHNTHPKSLPGMGEIYDKTQQAVIIKQYKSTIASHFDIETKYLIPRLLIPESDMLFISWKYATRFPLNIAPMWRSIQCVWRNIEEQIKIAASRVNRELIVYTGTYIINDSGNEIIHLEDIPVPHLFWKIVHDPQAKRAIAFITSNTPYENSVRICENVCEANSWLVSNSAIKIGDAYCCDAIKFLDKLSPIGNIFKDVEILGILQMPEKPLIQFVYHSIQLGNPDNYK